MGIFKQLENNKGTVSSQLGKDLAARVLAGETDILNEAIKLSSYALASAEEKNIRAGAAKIVETVAEKRPELVALFLEQLLPALEAEEPQTRWMIIRTFGFCAKENPKTAARGFDFAKQYIRQKTAGQLCLVSSADLYLGDFGALSGENAQKVFPLLLESCDTVIMNEHDWLLEAFMKILPYLREKQKKEIISFADEYAGHSRKATLKRVEKLKKMCGV